jgi:hypothetical protein
MFDSDIAAMFADQLITVPVIYAVGGTSTRGIMTQVQVFEPDPSGGYATTSKDAVEVVTGSLGVVPNDGSAVINVDGVDYRVRDIRKVAPHFQHFIIA